MDDRSTVAACVWRADDIGGKAGLTHALSAAERAAFDGLAAATAQDDDAAFESAVLDDLGRTLREAVGRGRGCVVLTGLDPDRYGEDGYRRIFWRLGRLVGTPVMQSERGDLMGYVRQEKDNRYGRGYISNMELRFHSDFHEVLALACVRQASEGGESGFVSGPMLRQMMGERRPDLLPALYEGHVDGLDVYYQLPASFAWVPRGNLPVFSEADGHVSLVLADHFYQLAAKHGGEAVPARLTEGIEVLRGLSTEPGVAANFQLRPGEMVFWHNWTVLHSRTAFVNAPGQERVLMRLWLHAHERRPTHPAVFGRAVAVDAIHAALLEAGPQVAA